MKRRQDELSREYKEALTRYGAGNTEVVSRKRQLEAADLELRRTEAEFENLARAQVLGYSGKSRILLQPVAVELKNASVRQAATALSKAMQVPIDIQVDVPDTLRLTVQARGVSFGAVLQAIAKQANLKISPGDRGIVLTSWPMVLINDQLQVFKGAWAPWSSEWGILPGYQTSDGWDFPGEAEPLRNGIAIYGPVDPPAAVSPPASSGVRTTPGLPSPDPLVGGYSTAVPGTPFGTPDGGLGRSNRSVTSSAAMGISVAALGERTIAVSEPGRGTEGQFGAWITVYRIDGAQLKKIAAGFHPLHGSTAGRGTAPGMMPGMGGLPGAGLPGSGSPLPNGSIPFGAAGGAPGAPVPLSPEPDLSPPTLTTVLPTTKPASTPTAAPPRVTIRTYPVKKTPAPKGR